MNKILNLKQVVLQLTKLNIGNLSLCSNRQGRDKCMKLILLAYPHPHCPQISINLNFGRLRITATKRNRTKRFHMVARAFPMFCILFGYI
jgi:hypothetical protein